MADTPRILLSLRGIGKFFPGVRALDSVDFELRTGEVHVLLGQNGAGKSTLMKILSGIFAPDEGEMQIDGAPVAEITPQTAAMLGIAMVHQELCLLPALSVTENILLGRMPRTRLGMLDWARAHGMARALLDELGVRLDPRRPVHQLEVAEQQLVEIAKALAQKPRIILLDEPTSALSDSERARLFEVIARLRRTGVGLIYISHHLSEIPLVGTRVTVLRDGRVVGSFERADVGEGRLVALMVGREVGNQFPRGARAEEPGAPAIEANGLRFADKLDGIDISLRYGEILGVFGLMGAGQAELARVLFGLDALHGGRVRIDGQEARFEGPADAIAAGMALISRDRRQSLVPVQASGFNIALPWLAGRSLIARLDHRREAEVTRDYIRSLRIDPPLPDREVRFFSGGNQQKVVLARWMSSGSRILIFDEPARGIDVGAKAEVFALMGELARNGAAVLLISSEPAEIEGMADRAIVLRKGRIAAHLAAGDITQQELLQQAG